MAGRFEVEKVHLTAMQKRFVSPSERGPFFVVVDRETGERLHGRYRNRSGAQDRADREERRHDREP